MLSENFRSAEISAPTNEESTQKLEQRQTDEKTSDLLTDMQLEESFEITKLPEKPEVLKNM